MHLRLPQLDPLLPLPACLDLRTWEPDHIAFRSITNATREFAKVFIYMPPTPLQQVIHGFILLMADMDHFQRSGTPHIGTVVLMRSMCIREVLLLPDRIEAMETEVLIYQMCRLSRLLCCQTWLYAYSGQNHSWTRNLPRRLVHKLKPILEQSVALTVHNLLPDFCLWIVTMGLMLAYEDLDNTGDDVSVRLMIPSLQYLDVELSLSSWPTIRSIVSRFLWYERVCDITAMEAWELACQMYTGHGETP